MTEGTDAPETGTDSQTDAPDTGTESLQAEIEKWKSVSRKHEERAKANSGAAKELEELRKASMNDQEKAVETARAEARAEALREVGGRVVDAEIKAAFAGRGVDVDALLEGLDRSKFLSENGDPDVDAITAWRDRVAPERESEKPAGFPDLGQGARGGRNHLSLNGDELLSDAKRVLGIR